jgi:2-oxoisovalerate dehydrogenase E1 component
LAAKQLLERQGLSIHDIALVIASTTTPDQVTPSLACRVAAALTAGRALLPVGSKRDQPTLPAYDINAACSGYLYALAQAFDFLQQHPAARVLVITSEVLSPLLDLTDFDTTPLFADAATATLVVGSSWRMCLANEPLPPTRRASATIRLLRPILSGRPEDGTRLSVPLCGGGTIGMSGKRIFTEAVRSMTETLAIACQRSGLTLSDLSQVIPHQANQRILDALAARAMVPVFSNIRYRGNSSSSTIPLALSELLTKPLTPQTFGLASFGGGFTFGAALAVFSRNWYVDKSVT